MRKILKRQRGFTFVELLVVVTIIALLTGAGAISFQSTSKKARDAKRMSDLEQIRSALELCRAEEGSYPLAIDDGVECGTNVYLSPLPKDPKNGAADFGYTYTYISGTEYSLCATTMEGNNAISPYCVKNP